MTFARNRIRLRLNTLTPLKETSDYVTGSRPKFPRARALSVECAIYSGDTLLALTGITSMVMEVKVLTSSGVIDSSQANVMSKTVSSASFNANLTSNEFEEDDSATPYHCAFEFSPAEATLTMTSAVKNELRHGFVITAITAAGRVTVGTGYLICVEEGGSGAGVVVAPEPTYTYTDDEIQAMVAGRVALGENPAGAATIWVSKDGTKKVMQYLGNDGSMHFETIS